MVQATLVEADIEQGRAALKAFDEAGLGVRSAFWLLRQDELTWRLRVFIPSVDQDGPKLTYERVQKVLQRNKQITLPVWSFEVVGSRDVLTRGLRASVKTSPRETDGNIRLFHNIIGDQLISDGYVYRSA